MSCASSCPWDFVGIWTIGQVLLFKKIVMLLRVTQSGSTICPGFFTEFSKLLITMHNSAKCIQQKIIYHSAQWCQMHRQMHFQCMMHINKILYSDVRH
jgi:hypothetical protein